MDVCKIEVCDRTISVKKVGLCRSHYVRSRHSKGIPMDTPIKPYTFVTRCKGREPKWLLNNCGYLIKRMCASYGDTVTVLQHRQVMEEYLGRPMLKTETVHHRNGVKTDNRIENLELWAVRQPKGQRAEDLVTYAQEILERYGPYAPPPKIL